MKAVILSQISTKYRGLEDTKKATFQKRKKNTD